MDVTKIWWLQICLSQVSLRTMTQLMKLIKWSLEALFEGVWPRRAPSGQEWPLGPDRLKAGTPLAEGFYGVLWSVQGDLDWYAKTLGMAHWRHHKPCWLCHCVNEETELKWNNLEPDAPWKRHPRHMEDFVASFPRARYIMEVPGMSLARLSPDWMHVKHLGIDQRALGSILHLLVFQLSNGTPQNTMVAIFDLVKDYYSRNGISSRFANLKLSMFLNPTRPHADYPRLKGKANEIRHFIPALRHVWQLWPKHPPDPMWEFVTALLDISFDLEEVVNSHDGFVVKDRDKR